VNDETGKGPEELQVGQVTPLRREAIMVTRDRGRLGLLFAMCTLAGVAMGFGLRGVQSSHCPARAAAEAPPPARSVSCTEGCTWLGIQMVDTREGVRVVRVFENTPAAELADGGLLQPGDYIHSIDGSRMHRSVQVIRQIRAHGPGDVVSMRLRRPGQKAVVMLEAELGWITAQQFHGLR
jgi:hypothetical protein